LQASAAIKFTFGKLSSSRMRCCLDRNGARPAYQFQARLLRIVHEEQSHAIITGKIAKRNILPVAAEVGKAQRLLVEDPDKAGAAHPSARWIRGTISPKAAIQAFLYGNRLAAPARSTGFPCGVR
jgi:hypothetical protein